MSDLPERQDNFSSQIDINQESSDSFPHILPQSNNKLRIIVSLAIGLIVVGVIFLLIQVNLPSTAQPETATTNHTIATPTTTPIPTSDSPSTSPTLAATSQTTPTSNPASIKVISIAYIPIHNDQLDTTNHIKDDYAEYDYSLVEVRKRIEQNLSGVIATLESGSRYHGYKQSSPAYLDYVVLNQKEYLEPVPLSDKMYGSLPLPNYLTMLNREDICNYVDTEGVKEVWLWTYHGNGKSLWESNFSSPIYPDISNSDRDPSDLPICQHSYTVYDYNYGRGTSEAIEDHIHQYEAIFRYVDEDLFWNKFVGYFPGGNWATSSTSDHRRRCGWAHFPPNGEKDYDWDNSATVSSDCQNWNPDTYGTPTMISCTTWGCSSLGFFEWWMQNIPGVDNEIGYQGKLLRNWWEFIADFDKAMAKGKSLVE